MNKTHILVIIGVAVTVAFPVTAATLFGNDTVSITTPIGDDTYAAGGTVSVTNTVEGDAAVAGGQILVTGMVRQDVLAAGGSVNIQGAVTDDVRAAGGNVMITGPVGDDVALAGGSLTLAGNVTVGGDAILAGGAIIIDGTIQGNAKIVGGEVIINGTINGNTTIKADKLTINGTINGPAALSAITLELGDAARFSTVEYWREGGEMDFGDRAQGGARFNPDLAIRKGDVDTKGMLAGLFAAWFIFSVLTSAAVIGVFIALFRRSIGRTAALLKKNVWKHVGVGLLYFIVTPFIAIMLFVTVIGWPLGLAVMAGYLISILFAKAFTSIVLAQWLNARSKKNWGPFMLFLVSVGIYIVLKLLILIPVIGWIICMIAVSAAFGAGFLFKTEMYKSIEQHESH